MEINTLTLITILATALILVIGGFLAIAFYYSQRTKRLKEEFGPEYDRTMDETGSRQKAEASLEGRQERVEALQMRTLSSDEQNHFAQKWQSIRVEFVDDPGSMVDESDRLVTEVMLALGYPMANFDQRIEDLSVEYPEVVSHYRDAHSTAVENRLSSASTEKLRQAILDYQMVFEELLGINMSEVPEYEMVMAE